MTPKIGDDLSMRKLGLIFLTVACISSPMATRAQACLAYGDLRDGPMGLIALALKALGIPVCSVNENYKRRQAQAEQISNDAKLALAKSYWR
jgi:hypothetical protein